MNPAEHVNDTHSCLRCAMLRQGEQRNVRPGVGRPIGGQGVRTFLPPYLVPWPQVADAAFQATAPASVSRRMCRPLSASGPGSGHCCRLRGLPRQLWDGAGFAASIERLAIERLA